MNQQVKTILLVIGVLVAMGLAVLSYKNAAGPSTPELTPEQIQRQFQSSSQGAPTPR